MVHRRPSRDHSKRACQLYTSPSLSTILPVYTNVNLTWNSACLQIPSNIDLYLSVLQPTGLIPVHVWSGVTFAKGGVFSTQLKPSWWNATTGAGSVQAQLAITPSGSPIWNTPAPSGPLFTISYNGSYPSVTASAAPAAYTGPSVESFASPPSNSISSGSLGAAIAVPLLALIAIVVGYVTWNRSRKRPEKKRWSQAIDQRMSMVSDGTWAPPRASMSTRPGSMVDPSRPSYGRSSFHSNRASFAPGFDSPLRNSSFEGSRVSPLGREGARRPRSLANGSESPSSNGEMRQIGQGERQSRVSFAGERPLTMVGGRARSSIGGTPNNRASVYSRKGTGMRNSMAGSLISNEDLPSPPKPMMQRSGTKEELANAVFVTNPQATGPTRLFGPASTTHRRQASVSSSLRQEVGAPLPPGTTPPRSPFSDDYSLSRPPPAMMSTHMPMMANRNSIVSPDEAMASYARARDLGVPALPSLPSNSPSLKRSPLVRSASTFLKTAPGRIMRSLSALATNNEEPETEEPMEGDLSSSDSKAESDFEKSSKNSSPSLHSSPTLPPSPPRATLQIRSEQPIRRGSNSPTIASVYSQKEEE